MLTLEQCQKLGLLVFCTYFDFFLEETATFEIHKFWGVWIASCNTYYNSNNGLARHKIYRKILDSPSSEAGLPLTQEEFTAQLVPFLLQNQTYKAFLTVNR